MNEKILLSHPRSFKVITPISRLYKVARSLRWCRNIVEYFNPLDRVQQRRRQMTDKKQTDGFAAT